MAPNNVGRVIRGRTTLGRFVAEEPLGARQAQADLGALLLDLASALCGISSVLAQGRLFSGRKALESVARELVLDACARNGRLAALASKGSPALAVPSRRSRGGGLLLVLDPLAGSASLDVNGTAATVFSVLAPPEGAGDVGETAFLQPGSRQLCAGYATYGPSTMVVLTAGRGVHGFTLEPATGELVLTHPELRIPGERREAASAPSPAGEVQRILVHGGAFPAAREPASPARLQLLHEAAPLALVVEQAGGVASTGRGRILDVVPRALDDQVPALLGSRREVERLVRPAAGAEPAYASPLFRVRSLLRET